MNAPSIVHSCRFRNNTYTYRLDWTDGNWSVEVDLERLLHMFLDILTESNKAMSAGSFSRVYIVNDYAIRYTPLKSNGLAFLTRINSIYTNVGEANLSCRMLVVGQLFEDATTADRVLLGEMIVMQKLYPVDHRLIEEVDIYPELQRISERGFHNDLTLANIMQTESESNKSLRIIDFDLFDTWKVVIAVSGNSLIEFDFRHILEKHLSLEKIPLFRSYYDYTYLSLCVDGRSPLYGKLLARLQSLFGVIGYSSMEKIAADIQKDDANALQTVPIEVLVRVPGIEAITVNLFDLRGNAYAHGIGDWKRYPSLVRSHGVYWDTQKTGCIPCCSGIR